MAKKAKHKHEYEPVLLRYTSNAAVWDEKQGFTRGKATKLPGRRCKICGRLGYGLPDEINKALGQYTLSDIENYYPDIDIVDIDINHLND